MLFSTALTEIVASSYTNGIEYSHTFADEQTFPDKSYKKDEYDLLSLNWWQINFLVTSFAANGTKADDREILQSNA